MIELRIDSIRAVDLKRLLNKRPKPFIVTNRRAEEGGNFSGSEDERLALLKEAVELGADYIDVELSTDKEWRDSLLKEKKNTQVIVSYHNWKETPSTLNEIFYELCRSGGSVVKIATFANRIDDNLTVRRLQGNGQKVIKLCLGEKGQLSRVLYKNFGSWLTYASLPECESTAPGQIQLDQMRRLYRVSDIGPETHVFGLIGTPVKHSIGKNVFNTLFKLLEMNCVYLPLETVSVASAVSVIRELGISGVSVTSPHKIEIMAYLDEVDIVAQEIGAVNTVVNRNRQLIGFNTDGSGAAKAIEARTELRGKKVVILGAGGAARALAYAIKNKGGTVTILNRTVPKAKKWAEACGAEFGGLDKLHDLKPNILINTTSIGNENESLVPKELVKNMLVMDIVYHPLETRLLKDARQAGCEVIEGVEMYVNQCAEQFQLFTGRTAPIDVLRKIARESLIHADGDGVIEEIKESMRR